MKHKISIITPSYNSSGYLERAIESVLRQDYDSWEHIIMDGGSTDGTVEIIKKYPHLIWKSEKDRGQSDAMNKGFHLSTGNIIVYLNADDYFEQNVFNAVIGTFTSTQADMVVGKLNRVNANNIITDVQQPSLLLADILDVAALKFPLNPVCYFYTKELQQKVGGFPAENHYTMDYWFLLRAYKTGKIAYIDKVLGNFHQHGDNKTAGYFEVKKSQFEVLHEFCKQYGLDSYPYVKNFLDKILARHRETAMLANECRQIKETLFFKVGKKLHLFPKAIKK